MFGQLASTCEKRYYKINYMRDASSPKLKLAAKILHVHPLKVSFS